MKTIFFATSNEGKAKELCQLTAVYDAVILTLKDFPDFKPPPETGMTFEENAIIKAQAAAAFSGIPALADDSGLCVDALNGAPGVHSARYSGEGAGDDDNNAKLLAALADVPTKQRGAHYMAVFALAHPDGTLFTAEGRVDGVIAEEYRGAGGFGYDPLFYLPEYAQTMAELSPDQKNAVSHRGRAFRAILAHLMPLIKENPED